MTGGQAHVLTLSWGESTDDGPCAHNLHRGDCSCGRWTSQRMYRSAVLDEHARHVADAERPAVEATIAQIEDILARHGCLAAVPTEAIRDLARYHLTAPGRKRP